MITLKQIRSESIRRAYYATLLATRRAAWGMPEPVRDRIDMVCTAFSNPHATIIAAYDLLGSEWELVGAVSYRVKPDLFNPYQSLRIDALGSFQAKVGSTLIREVENAAKRLGAGISLMPLDASEGFYAKMGYSMRSDGDMEKLDYVKSPNELTPK